MRGIVIINLGTPDAPTPRAVRRYLAEFLGDPKVVDLPKWSRWFLLNAVILPFRPRRTAHAYQQVWMEGGSPLLVHSKAQRDALQTEFPETPVVLAMRYGKPSLGDALEAMRAKGVTELVAVPMYPQYAQATSGSTVDAWTALWPSAHFIEPFYRRRYFVETAASLVAKVAKETRADKVLFSYHGLPLRQLAKVCTSMCKGPCQAPTDTRCYRAQCFATTQMVARVAGVESLAVTSFQSRLKGTTWMSPFTDQLIIDLARSGTKRLAVAPLAFVADCIETLEEIGIRAKNAFRAAGGDDLALVPAVNDSHGFIHGLAQEIRGQWRAPP